MENQSLLAYLQRSLAMVMNEVTLNQAPTSNSLFAGDSEFAISLLVDSIERVLQHGRKSKFFGEPVPWDVFCEFGRRPWATAYLGTANANGDSDHEKGRIFLRFLLQHQLLVVFADELSQNEDIIEEYYEPNAIMARSDDYAIFRQQLVSLELLPLKFPGAPARQQPNPTPVQPAPSSPPPKKVEQPAPTQIQAAAPPAAPVVVTAASKKKKTVNRIISFDTESTDSTVKKVAKRPPSTTYSGATSGTSSLENSALSTSTEDLSLSTSVEVVAPQPIAPEEPAITPAPQPATLPPSPSPPPVLEAQVETPKNEPETQPEPITPKEGQPVEPALLVAEAAVAPPEPEPTPTEEPQPDPVVPVAPEATQSTEQQAQASVDDDETKSDDEDDDGEGPLQLHVRHDDDHDSLDSASGDEGDYPVPSSSVNATVDSIFVCCDGGNRALHSSPTGRSAHLADLSKLLAGFAASFSDNQ
eukprot:TRINITY_DN10060_c0_g1_i1.p1 TRINITY_DN10060_c0_g1~~TRINITY_DN10060_c0_g1_i1.p1  ORF type:complete len:472 (-),score=96.57 TRINITY_DN10060_c0_g1_i1:384-1799(-)